MEGIGDLLVTMEILFALIVAVVFFVLADNVAKLRREAEKQTKLLRLMALAASGQPGIVGRVGKMQSWVDEKVNGKIRLFSEDWECRSASRIGDMQPARVTAIDGIMLTVVRHEEVK